MTKRDSRSRLCAALVMAAAVRSAACGSSATPTTPSPTPTSGVSARLTIAGTTVLTAVGQTAQLSARNDDGSALGGVVTWQTSAGAVATVSQTGLVTAAGVGNATITAISGSLSGTVPVYVLASTPGATRTLTACQTIRTPGKYLLDADLGVGMACIAVGPAVGVQIDCQGHVLAGLTVTDVNTVSVANCVLGGILDVERATNVNVTDGTFPQGVFLRNVTSLTLADSTIIAPRQSLEVVNGTAVDIVDDAIHVTDAFTGVWLVNGANNHVRQSTINGTYDGGAFRVGPDDGIVLQGEEADIVTGNTISGVYDAGIEGVGTVHDTVISNNTISNIGTAGIGAYWCTDWVDNTLQANSVAGAPRLAKITYAVGNACGEAMPAAALTGTQFVGNRFDQPTTGVEFLAPGAPAARLLVSAPGAAGGNVLRDNDFGANDGPSLQPLSAFTDGGGNVCAPLNSAVSNFACTGATAIGAGVSAAFTRVRSRATAARRAAPLSRRTASAGERR